MQYSYFQMTELDAKLTEFKKLVNLNLCGNYIVDLDATLIPRSVKSIELQANGIKSVKAFAEHLPQELLYMGLARNFLDSGKRLTKYFHFNTVVNK